MRAGGGYAQHRRRTMPAKRADTTDRDPVRGDTYTTRNAESWQGRPQVGDVVTLNAASRQEGNVPSEIPRVVFITDLDAYICQDEPKLIYFIVSDHVANMNQLLLPSSYP